MCLTENQREYFASNASQMEISVCVCHVCVCVRARSCVGGLLEQGIFCVGEERGLGTSSSLVCTAKKGRGQKSGRLENSALHADRSGFKRGGRVVDRPRGIGAYACVCVRVCIYTCMCCECACVCVHVLGLCVQKSVFMCELVQAALFLKHLFAALVLRAFGTFS